MSAALFAIAAYLIACAAWIGNALGAKLAARDERRRAARQAVETVILESGAYRQYARRKVWAA
jgi:hypothetical protein